VLTVCCASLFLCGPGTTIMVTALPALCTVMLASLLM
jgi:hypothetical protein